MPAAVLPRDLLVHIRGLRDSTCCAATETCTCSLFLGNIFRARVSPNRFSRPLHAPPLRHTHGRRRLDIPGWDDAVPGGYRKPKQIYKVEVDPLTT